MLSLTFRWLGLLSSSGSLLPFSTSGVCTQRSTFNDRSFGLFHFSSRSPCFKTCIILPVITRGQCYTIILEPEPPLLEFLAVRGRMLFFLSLLFARNPLEMGLILSLKNSLIPTTWEPQSSSDRSPFRASCRGRPAARTTQSFFYFAKKQLSWGIKLYLWVFRGVGIKEK